jgi:restriction endonuclease S subunit
LRKLSENRGGNQPNLNGEIIKSLSVPFPEKKIQKTMVEKYNLVRANSQQIQEKLKKQQDAADQIFYSTLKENFRIFTSTSVVKSD